MAADEKPSLKQALARTPRPALRREYDRQEESNAKNCARNSPPDDYAGKSRENVTSGSPIAPKCKSMLTASGISRAGRQESLGGGEPGEVCLRRRRPVSRNRR